MKARTETPASRDTGSSENKSSNPYPLRSAGVVLAIAVILFMVVPWPNGSSNAARPVSSDASQGSADAYAFDYFPAQFGKPAAYHAPEEHIPTF